MGSFLFFILEGAQTENFEMHVLSLRQHKQVVIYEFSLQVAVVKSINCGLDHNLV